MAPSIPIKLSCSISAKSPQDSYSGVWLEFKVKSKYDQILKLLPWQTPLEGIMGDLFIINDENGEKLSYQGPLVKRAAPKPDDYVEIVPDQILTNQVNILRAYLVKQGKTYSLNLNNLIFNLIDENNVQHFVKCDAEQISISVE